MGVGGYTMPLTIGYLELASCCHATASITLHLETDASLRSEFKCHSIQHQGDTSQTMQPHTEQEQPSMSRPQTHTDSQRCASVLLVFQCAVSHTSNCRYKNIPCPVHLHYLHLSVHLVLLSHDSMGLP
jgi:hypothetical protein